MIVAMASMGMMQPAIDEIILMIAVWDRLVAATGTMLVVDAAVRASIAFSRIASVDGNGMFLDRAASILMVHMAVVEIVDMTVVADRGMTAAGTVDMIVRPVMM